MAGKGMFLGDHAFENFPIDGWQFVLPGFLKMQGIIQREMSISDPGKMERFS